MILSLSRTLPNGHRDVIELTKTTAGAVRAKAVPGAKLTILADGQPLTGKEVIHGKTPQLKKLGQDLLIEIDDEIVAQIEDFYATPGATLDGSYWAYTELAALSPAASLAADIAPVAASEASSGLTAVWWTALGVSGAGAVAAAAAASGGSSGSSSSGKQQSEQSVDKTQPLTTVSGTVMAGPLLPGHGLFVTLHHPDGSVLAGPVRVGDDSTFTLQIPASYKGPILARVVDSNNAADILDEASTQPINLSHSLRAALVSSGESALQIVVTPLTELVVRKLGLAPSQPDTGGTSASELSEITAEQILHSNADIAERFGLEHGLFELPSLVIDTQGKPTAAANFAGHILAALSGLQGLHGAELGMEYPLAASELEDPAQLQALLIVGEKMAVPPGAVDPLESFVAAASNSPLGQALKTAVERAQSMTEAELGAFDRKDIAAIPLPVLAAMTPEQLGKLSKEAVAAFDPVQLRVLGNKELNLLANQGKLSKEQLSSLSDTQLAGLFAPDKLDPVVNKSAFAADGTIKHDALGPDQPPLLSGTLPTPLPAGAKLAIYDGLTYLGDAVVGADGKSWTFMPDSLPEGPHNFSAHVELGNGKSVASDSFDHDKAIDAARALTDKDLAAFNRHTIATLPPPVLAELTPEQLAKLSKDAVAGLSPHHLQALDLSQLAALTKDGKLNAEQLSTLSESQLAALFPPATLDPVVNDKALAADGTLNPDPNRPPLLSGTLPAPLPAGAKVAIYDGLNYLGDAVVGTDGKSWTFAPDSLSKGPHDFSAHLEFGGGASVASAAFDHDKAIDAARAMTEDVLAALDRHSIAAIPRPVLAELTPEQLGKLSKDAVAGLSPHQLQALDLSQLAALAQDGKLNAEQLSTLSDSQLAALFPPPALNPVVNKAGIAEDGTLNADAFGPGKPALLSGTLPAPLPPGAKVGIYDGLTRLGDAVVGPDGKTWTFTPDSLAPGTHDFSAHVELGNGTTIASASFDHDKAIEAAHALTDDALAAFDRHTIATLHRPVLAELTPDQLGKLNRDAVAGLSPDQLQALDLSQLAALVQDGKLTGDQLSTLSDTQLAALFPPAALDPIVNDNALAADGTLNPDAVGPGHPPLLSGTLPAPLPPGAKVGIYDGLTRLGDAVVGPDGKTWTFTPDSLAPGTHDFSAHVELGNGTTIASASFDHDKAIEAARALTDDALAAFDRNTIATLPRPVLAELTPDQLGKLSQDAVAGLTPDQLQALDLSQLAALTKDGKLNAEQLATLSDTQLAALFPPATLDPVVNDNALAADGTLNPDAIGPGHPPLLSGTLPAPLPPGAKVAVYDGLTYLGDAVVGADGKTWTFTPDALPAGPHDFSVHVELGDGKSIASASFDHDKAIEAAHKLTDQDLAAFTGDTIASLSRPVLAELTPEQLDKLSKDAVAGLSPDQLQALDMSQLAALAKAGKLIDEQLGTLSNTQLAALANAGTLTTEQLSTLSDSQLAAIFPPATLDPVLKADALNPDGTINPDAIGPDQPPLLSGTLPTPLPPGAKVAVYDGLTRLGEAVVGPDGKTWTFTPDALEPGLHDFSTHIEFGNGKSIASASFDSDRAIEAAHNLTDQDLAAFTDDTIAAVPRPVLAELTPEQLGKLSPDAVAGLSPDQLQAFDLAQLTALASAGNLSAEQADSLSDAQLKALFPPSRIEPVVSSEVSGFIDANASSKDATLTVTGELPVKLPTGATVGIFDGGTRLGDAVVQADGITWSFTPDPLSNGAHALSAHVELQGGRTVSSTDVPFDVFVPTLAVAIDLPIAGDDIINAAEKAAGVTISGNAQNIENGGTVTVQWGSGNFTSDVIDGRWSLVVDSGDVPANASASTITAFGQDNFGNRSASVTKSVAIQATAPTVTIAEITGDDIINAAEKNTGVEIRGSTTGVEDGQTIEVQWGTENITATVTGNAWTARVDSAAVPADGSATEITAAVSDLAGNPAPQARRAVTIDTTAPTIMLTAPNGIVNAAAKAAGVTMSGSTTGAENGQTITIDWADSSKTATINNDAWSVVFANSDIPSDSASSVITMTVSDRAGNSTSLTSNVAIDTVLPTVDITSDTATINPGETARITFTFSEAPIGFDITDITTVAGTLSDLIVDADDPKVYTATLTAHADRAAIQARISLAADTYADAAGNHDSAEATLEVAINIDGATLAITTGHSNLDDATLQADSVINIAETQNDRTVSFNLTFSNAVTGVTTDNFALHDNAGNALTGVSPAMALSGSGTNWTITVSNLTGLTSDSLRLDLVNSTGITDALGLALSMSTLEGAAFTVDIQAPEVSSVTPAGASEINAGFENDNVINQAELSGAVDFDVTFDEAVSGVGTSHFTLSDEDGHAIDGATPVIESVTAKSPTVYTVRVGQFLSINSSQLKLNVNNNDGAIRDAAGNSLSTAFTAGTAFTIESEAHITTIALGTTEGVNSRTHATSLNSVDFLVTFSHTMAAPQANAFVVTLDGAKLESGVAIAEPTLVAANQYRITVSGSAIADANGQLALALAADHGLRSSVGNTLSAELPDAGPNNQAYLLDNIPPVVVMSRNSATGNHIVPTTQAGVAYSLDDTTPRLNARVTGHDNIRSIKMALNLDTAPVIAGGEILSIAGTNIHLDGSNPPASVTVNGASWTVSYADNTLTLTTNVEDGVSNALAQALLRNTTYIPQAEVPVENRVVSITLTNMTGNTSKPSRVTFSSDTQAPVVDLNGTDTAGRDYSANLTIAQANSGYALVGGSAISITEERQIGEIQLDVSGLINGSSEKLRVGETDLNLDGSNLPATVSDGTNTWTVAFSAEKSDTAKLTFTLAKATSDNAETLLQSMQYQNTANLNVDGIRTFSVSVYDNTGNVNETPATASLIINSVAPTRSAKKAIETIDANHDGVLGDQFYLNFSEQVDSSKIVLANLRLSGNTTLGLGAAITAIDPITFNGVTYASQYLVASGVKPSYTTGTTITIAAADVVDSEGHTADTDVVFSMPDIVAPNAPQSPATISTDNFINNTEKNSAVTFAFAHTAAQAGDTLKLYVDGVWRTDVAMTAGRTSTSVTLNRDDWNQDGLLSVTARVQDAAGNLSAHSVPKPVTLDTVLENGFESVFFSRDAGTVGRADSGDTITVRFHESVQLTNASPDTKLFGTGATVTPLAPLNGFAKDWLITLGANPVPDLATKTATFNQVRDLADNQGSISGVVPADVFSSPGPVFINNVTLNNVLSKTEVALTQSVNINVGRMLVGDTVRLFMDGVEVGSTTASAEDVARGSVTVSVAPDSWGADGTRALTATAQRGEGSVIPSNLRSVYVAADQEHWAGKDVLWLDPDTLAGTAPISSWQANTENTTFTNGFVGTYSATATRNDQFVPLPGHRNGHTMLHQRDYKSSDGFNLNANSAIIGGQYQGSIAVGVTAIYNKPTIDSAKWPTLIAIGDRIDGNGANRILLSGTSPNAMTFGPISMGNAISAKMPSTYVLQLNDLTSSTGTSDTTAHAQMTAYLNGLASETRSFTGTVINAQTYAGRIGTIGYFDEAWTGEIGDVAYFLRTTTANEMAEFSVYQGVKYATQGTLVAPRATASNYDLTTSANTASLLNDVLDLSLDASGAGKDTITVAGADYVNAGAGDDIVKIRDLSFRLLDGGLGHDTLTLDSAFKGSADIVLADFVSNARGNSTAPATNNVNIIRDIAISAWFRSSGVPAAIADTVLAPDNTLTADRLTLASTPNIRDYMKVFTGLTAGQTYTFSVWVKLDTASALSVSVNDGVSIGTIAGDKQFTADDGLSKTDWQRVSISFTASSTQKVQITLGNVDSGDWNDGPEQTAGTVYVWGAQLDQGSRAPAVTIEQLLADARVNEAGYHKLQGFEHIDLAGSADAQTLTVSAADVNQLSETNTLWVTLGDNDGLRVKDFGSVEYGYWQDKAGNVFDRHWTANDDGTNVNLYSRGGLTATTWERPVMAGTSVQLGLDLGAAGSTQAADWTSSQGTVTNAVLQNNIVTLTLDGVPTGAITLDYTGTGITDVLGSAPRFGKIWIGGIESDALDGSAGTVDQAFYAGVGGSVITGGNGADLLAAGNGNDTLTGGGGADIFHWGAGLTGTDTVTDFVKTQGDKIDLSKLLSDSDFTVADKTSFLKLTQSDNDAILAIDLEGSAAFATPTLTIVFTNGWTDGGLSVGLDDLLQQQIIKA